MERSAAHDQLTISSVPTVVNPDIFTAGRNCTPYETVRNNSRCLGFFIILLDSFLASKYYKSIKSQGSMYIK